MWMKYLKVIAFVKSIIILIMLSSCLPTTEKSTSVSCEDGKKFNAHTRSCDIDNSVQNITIYEDDIASKILEYSLAVNEVAVSCSIVTYTYGIIVSDCRCVGGSCSATFSTRSDYSGVGELIYTIKNKYGDNSSPIMAKVTTLSTNDAPVAEDSNTILVNDAESYLGDLSSLVRDEEDGVNLTYSVVDSPLTGTVSLNALTGIYTFTPFENYDLAHPHDSYNDTFTYRVTDSGGLTSETRTVTFLITPEDDAPVNTTTTASIHESCVANSLTLDCTIPLEYTDSEGDLANSCSVTLDAPLSEGEVCSCDVSGICSVKITMLDDDFNGELNFTYTITSDSNALVSDSSAVALNVMQVNDMPYIDKSEDNSALTHAGSEDVPYTISFEVNQGNQTDTLYELDQDLTLTVTSSNLAVVPLSGVQFKLDGTTYTLDGSGETNISAAAFASSTRVLDLVITPAVEASTLVPVDIHITITDSGGTAITGEIDQNDVTYAITFAESDDLPTIEAIGDISSNEGTFQTTTPFSVDEGGGTSEDDQQMTMWVETSNSSLLPLRNIEVFYDINDNDLAEASESKGIGDNGSGASNRIDLESVAADDASLHKVIIKVTPVNGQNGTATITVNITDSNEVAAEKSVTFDYLVHSIGALHGGWKDLVVTSKKVDYKGKIISTNSCSYTASGCNGGSNCTGILPPAGLVTADSAGAIYYDSNKNRCYKASAATNSNWSEVIYGRVELTWNEFTLQGSDSDSDASIGGYNVYRRPFNEAYDFSSPLNSTILSSQTFSYTDSTVELNQVYFYTVRPIDSKYSFTTATTEPYSEIRLLVPPLNMSFAHRWIINREMCNFIGQAASIDMTENFRCPYSGPGEVIDSGSTYYDIGHDLLVDTFEAGCPYTSAADAPECGANGCIGNFSPVTSSIDPHAVDVIFYNRANGKCYRSNGTNIGDWEIFSDSYYSSAIANASLKAYLPPLTNITQKFASEFCHERTDLESSDFIGLANDLAYKLPDRKEQIAYSAWNQLLERDSITARESGANLNVSSSTDLKCNTNNANGISINYTDTNMPTSPYLYSVPGTATSQIRSIATGSINDGNTGLTAGCLSSFNIQDHIGNVAEWVTEQFACTNDLDNDGVADLGENICTGVTAANAAGFGITRLETSSDNFEVDDNDYDLFAFDGARAGCNDIDQDGICDAGMESFSFDSVLYENDDLLIPMGLPAKSSYATDYPFSEVNPYLYSLATNLANNEPLQDWLFEDKITINSKYSALAAHGEAGVVGGGSYASQGNGAGRFSFELVPATTIASASAELEVHSIELLVKDISNQNCAAIIARDTSSSSTSITVEIVASGSVSGDSATVTVNNGINIVIDVDNTGATTASTLVDAINNDSNASALVLATSLNDAAIPQIVAQTNLSESTGFTLTAQTAGEIGNNIKFQLTAGAAGSAGSEVATLSGDTISVSIEEGVTTARQIATALAANAQIVALVNVPLPATVSNEEYFVAISSQSFINGYDGAPNARSDIGFRCVTPVRSVDYDVDAMHTYSY